MKKLTKKFLLLLLCFLTTSTFNVHLKSEASFSVEPNSVIANYNELYGIEESTSPQVVLNDAIKSNINLKYLAVFIEFSDSKDANARHLDDPESVSNAEKLFNSDQLIDMIGPIGTIKVPSFKKYYEMQSYGKLEITTEIFPKIGTQVASYIDPHPENYYKPYSSTNPIGYKDKTESLNRETDLIDNAIGFISNELAASGITADEIDTGSDGIVDAISFFIEGKDALSAGIGWGDLLWSHKMDNYGLANTILGKKVIAYNLLYTYDYKDVAGLFSLNRGTYSTMMHEYGHTLGFADLYRFDHSGSEPVGFYDMMGSSSGSNPQNFLTYFTSEYSVETAWHAPLETISSSTKNITLQKPKFQDPTEKRAIKLVPNASSKEYFIVEYTSKQSTYSNYTPDSDGLIVYRVNDNNKYNGNKEGGDHGELDHIFVFRPKEPYLGAGLGNLTEATLNMKRPVLGKDIEFSSTFDNETIYYSNGSNSGIKITIKSETPDSVTFDVTFPTLDGSGSEADPYIIRTTEEFLYFMEMETKAKHFKLLNDLDFSNYTSFPAITFKGHLDGANKTIKNVTSSTGLFETLGEYGSNTTVKNLKVENLTVSSTSGDSLGGLASVASTVSIENVHLLSGSVTNVKNPLGNTLASTGGFLGNTSDDVIIKNCSSFLSVSSFENVGGFIGLNMNATIVDCFSKSSVTGTKNVGGFIAQQSIKGSTYKVPVNAYYDAGLHPNAVGNRAALHDSNLLPDERLSEGITGITVLDNITLNKNEMKSFSPAMNPSKRVDYTIESKDTHIVSYVNNSLFGANRGVTEIYTRVTVGTMKMPFTTHITVSDGTSPLTEQQVLNYFGLSKKDNYIMGFAIGSNVKDIRARLSSLGGVTLKTFKNSSDQEIADGIISTGMSFTLSIDATDYTYVVVIKGDVNGDGLIYATDYVKIKNHIMNRPTLAGAYFLAADIDRDGNIYATDYVKIKNHIMGRGDISQK